MFLDSQNPQKYPVTYIDKYFKIWYYINIENTKGSGNMVDIKKAIKELQNQIKKDGNASAYLYLICDNYKNLGRFKFTLSFDRHYESGLMSVFFNDLIDNLQKKNIKHSKLEDLVKIYGDWYEILSKYSDDYDWFEEVPIDIAIKALSLIPFDSYEVHGHYPLNKDYLYG